jgi:hypothetical protein
MFVVAKDQIVDKKPVWPKNVIYYICYACVNFCPAHAVQIHSIPFVKSYSRENRRYPHPYAMANGIAEQK